MMSVCNVTLLVIHVQMVQINIVQVVYKQDNTLTIINNCIHVQVPAK